MAQLIPPSVRRSELDLWTDLGKLDDDVVVERLQPDGRTEVVISVRSGQGALLLFAWPSSWSEPSAARTLDEFGSELRTRLSPLLRLLPSELASTATWIVLLDSKLASTFPGPPSQALDGVAITVCVQAKLLTCIRSALAEAAASAPGAELERAGPRSYASCAPRPSAMLRDNSPRFAQTYLDEEQARAAAFDFDRFLPAEQANAAREFRVRLVTGVPGSGKTLLAMYRAQLLAAHFPEHKVLFLCHNTPLTATVSAELSREGYGRQTEVRTFSSWAFKHHQKAGGPQQVVFRDQRLRSIRELRQSIDIPARITADDILGELDHLNEQLIESLPEYQNARRTGRGFRLSRDERARLWQLHLAHRAELLSKGLTTHSEIVRSLCRRTDHELEPVHHIIIDEAQFFSRARFALIKRALAPGGHLFLCADPDQGFLGYGASWRSLGIVLGHRTKKLRRSYRTTRAILAAARSVLPEDARSEEREDGAEPDFSQMRDGSVPRILLASSRQSAVDRLVHEVSALASGGVSLGDMLIMHGEQVGGAQLAEPLRRRFGANLWHMNDPLQKRGPPSGSTSRPLRLAFVKTATGLEAKLVFLIGVESLWAGAGESARDQVSQQRLLYMAMTRAAQTLVLVTFEQPPSSWLTLFAMESLRCTAR